MIKRLSDEYKLGTINDVLWLRSVINLIEEPLQDKCGNVNKCHLTSKFMSLCLIGYTVHVSFDHCLRRRARLFR